MGGWAPRHRTPHRTDTIGIIVAEQNQKRNAYAVLGLHKDATDEEIKQAYVALVKKYDPEVHTDRFMVIQSAFERLKDPELRAREDLLTFNFIRGGYQFSKEEQAEVPDAKLAQAIEQLEARKQEDGTYSEDILPKLLIAYQIRARKNVERKLLKEAMDDWMLIRQLDPAHQRAKNNLLMAFIKLGYSYANHQLFDEAREMWEKAVKMDPDNHPLVHNIAICCDLGARHDEAKRFWDETIKRWDAMLERNPADEYRKSLIVEAHRHLSEISDRKPPSAPAAGRPPQAPVASRPAAPPRSAAEAPTPRPSMSVPPRQAAPTVASPPPSSPPQPSGVDDVERYRAILKLRPDDFDAAMRLGHLLMERKDWPGAVEHFREMRQKFPKNVDVINSLGWAQLNSQDVDQAFRTWRDGLRIDPKNHALREALTKAHMMMGRGLREKNLFINSLVHFKALAQLMPNSDEVHFELARTYQLQGDIRSAYGEFQKVIKLNPKHKEARKGLSELKMSRA
jgi:tetratricopeptide (TPR) repeat protein